MCLLAPGRVQLLLHPGALGLQSVPGLLQLPQLGDKRLLTLQEGQLTPLLNILNTLLKLKILYYYVVKLMQLWVTNSERRLGVCVCTSTMHTCIYIHFVCAAVNRVLGH